MYFARSGNTGVMFVRNVLRLVCWDACCKFALCIVHYYCVGWILPHVNCSANKRYYVVIFLLTLESPASNVYLWGNSMSLGAVLQLAFSGQSRKHNHNSLQFVKSWQCVSTRSYSMHNWHATISSRALHRLLSVDDKHIVMLSYYFWGWHIHTESRWLVDKILVRIVTCK